jgi:hypothetical protein
MSEHLPYFAEYDGQSLDEVLAMEGLFRLDSLVVTVEQALGVKAWREGDQSLSDAEGIVLAVEALQREMNAGGYWQFFAGSSAEFASGIVEALRRIGCPVTAEVTQAAMSAFGLNESMSTEEVTAAASEQDAQDVQGLNASYFASGEDLTLQLFYYIRDHRDSITIP